MRVGMENLMRFWETHKVYNKPKSDTHSWMSLFCSEIWLVLFGGCSVCVFSWKPPALFPEAGYALRICVS